MLLTALVLCVAVERAAGPVFPVRKAEDRRVTLIFAGDFMGHMPQVEAARQADGTFDFSDNFTYVASLWCEAGLAVGNLETTLAYRNFSGYPMFATPAAYAVAMHDAGIGLLTTVNNHCCDRGAAGIDRTIAVLDSLGIAHTGTFADSARYLRDNPLIIWRGGIPLAFLAYTYGTNGINTPDGRIVNIIDTCVIGRDIDRAKTMIPRPVIITLMHWGAEYTRQPDREQRELARFCVHRGADLIIGSHPHVVQPMEIVYRHTADGDSVGCPVVYSLGNFISNQRKRYTDGGIMALIDIRLPLGGRYGFTVDYIPAWVYLRSEQNRRLYSVIPGAPADSVITEPASRKAYETFIEDTRMLLGSMPLEAGNRPSMQPVNGSGQ